MQVTFILYSNVRVITPISQLYDPTYVQMHVFVYLLLLLELCCELIQVSVKDSLSGFVCVCVWDWASSRQC